MDGVEIQQLLDRGAAILGRYGAERVLLAVAVGALIQIVCLLVFRFVGTLLGLTARVLAWTLGVFVALYLLDEAARRPASAEEAIRWIGRLADLVA